MSKAKISLLIANLIVGFAIYLTFKDDTPEREDFNETLIYTLSNLESVKILDHQSDKKIELTKNSLSEWMLVKPYKWETNKLALSNLQTKLAHLKVKKLYELSELKDKGEILEDYGIDQNSPKIKLEAKENYIEFTIGDLTRDDSTCYCLVHLSHLNKKIIFKANKDIIDFCNTKVTDWTERNFIKTPLYAIDKISVEFGEGEKINSRTNLAKKNEKWVFTEPFKGEADTEKVLYQLNSLISASVIGFKDENNKQKVSNETWKAKLDVSGFNQTETFYFESTNEGLISGRKNSTLTNFLMDQDFLSLLNDWSTKLRTRTIFRFSLSDLQNIEVSGEDRKFMIFKDENQKWQISESNNSDEIVLDAEADEIKSFLREINSATVEQFLETSVDETKKEEYKMNQPIYKINIKYNNSSTNSYSFNRTTDVDKMWTVFDQNQSLICLIQMDFNKLLKINPITFRTKQLLPIDFQAEKVRLYDFDSNTTYKFESEQNLNTLEEFSNFTAESFVNSSFKKDGIWIEGDWIPWKYDLILSSEENNDSRDFQFRLSERKGANTWYGGDPVNGLIFKLPINYIDYLYEIIKNVD